MKLKYIGINDKVDIDLTYDQNYKSSIYIFEHL